MTDPITDLYCANHPETSTQLRCNRCSKPICSKCAVPTPTGYRCKECIRGQQKVFDTTVWYDYLLAIIISAILALIGSFIIPSLGFFSLLLAPVAGVAIAEAVRLVVRKRRSLRLYQVSAAAAALGSIPVIIPSLFNTFAMLPQGSFGSFYDLIWQVVYAFTVTSTVFYRLSGISVRR